MNARVLAACARMAETQYGVLTARQARAAGLSADAIQKLAREGHWTRVRPSVFALWSAPDPSAIFRQRLMAAALWLGPASAVSHRAAAVDWELDGIGSAPIELSTTGRRRASDAGLVVHRVRTLPSEEVVVRTGLPVTSAARTLVDLCSVVERATVELALESALRVRLVTIEQVASSLSRAGSTHRARTMLRPMLRAFPSVATESALESLVWRLLLDGGLPPPVRQYEVRDRTGRLVARVDFAYPDARLAIEADGHRFHSSRRDWARDLARQNALTALGWTVYRITWEDATLRPHQVGAAVSALLADRVRA